MPLIHLKSGSLMKRGQMCEIVQHGKQFVKKETWEAGARTLQKAAVESAKEGGRGN
jgi:hypothetical protein